MRPTSITGMFRNLKIRTLVLLLVVFVLKIGAGITLIIWSSMHMYVLDNIGVRSWYLPSQMLCTNNCSTVKADYTIANQKFCKEEVFLLVAVVSKLYNNQLRRTIRTTWGKTKEDQDQTIQVVFFVGSNGNAQPEADKYSDIVQVNIDDDFNLPIHKSVSILHWVNKYCPQAKYVLKTDDDSFNYLPNYASYLQTMNGVTFVGGHCFTSQPHRSKGSRYYDAVFTGSMYPIFCHGAGYILSQRTVSKIIHVSPGVVMVPMEDAYITGLCRVVADIPYVQIPGADVKQTDATACAFKNGLKTVQQTNSPGMQQLWQESYKVNELSIGCASYLPLVLIMSVIVVCIVFMAMNGMIRPQKFKKSIIFT